MYRVTVRDRVLVAHSLQGEIFGPARALHGCTYLVEATFSRAELDSDGLVVDIGRAHTALRACLADLDYANLDEHPELAGINTTTEWLAGFVWRRLAARVREGDLGGPVAELGITLRESDVAWAAYEAPVAG